MQVLADFDLSCSIMYAYASVSLCIVCMCEGSLTCSMMSANIMRARWNVKPPKLKSFVASGAISPDNDAVFNFYFQTD